MSLRTLSGNSFSNNVYVNTLSGGSALAITTASNSTSSTIDLKISKQDTQSTFEDDDLIVIENASGNIKKVSFGDTSGLSIKTKDPKARASFRARHKCDQKKDKTSAGYWSCRMWSGPDAVKNMLKK